MLIWRRRRPIETTLTLGMEMKGLLGRQRNTVKKWKATRRIRSPV